MSFFFFFRGFINDHRCPVYKPVVVVAQCLTRWEIPYFSFYHVIEVRYLAVRVFIWSKSLVAAMKKTGAKLCDILDKFSTFLFCRIPCFMEKFHYLAVSNLLEKPFDGMCSPFAFFFFFFSLSNNLTDNTIHIAVTIPFKSC